MSSRISTASFDGFVDYYTKRRKPQWNVWEQLKDVRASNPLNQYYVVFRATVEFSPLSRYCDPVHFGTHAEFESYIFDRDEGSNVRSELNGAKQGAYYDGSNAFELSIARGTPYDSSTLTYPRFLGRGRPGGPMSGTLNCVMQAVRDSVYYYDASGERRKKAWLPNGERAPYDPKLANNTIKNTRQRLDDYAHSHPLQMKWGFSVRELFELAEAIGIDIYLWYKVGTLFRLRTVAPANVDNHNIFHVHLLMTSLSHVEPLFANEVHLPSPTQLQGKLTVKYVSEERLRDILTFNDPFTKKDMVTLVKGVPTSLLNPEKARAGALPSDVVLQAGTVVYKHEATSELKGRYSTTQACEDYHKLKEVYTKLNLQPLNERHDRRNYRAITESDNVIGCRCKASEPEQTVYKFDTRMCYGADFHKLYEEGGFPYFHGYPRNPNGQEYQGPIGNRLVEDTDSEGNTFKRLRKDLQTYTFKDDRFAVFKVVSLDISNMEANTQAILCEVLGIHNGMQYVTRYIASPLLHWFEAHGAYWVADTVWVFPCTMRSWCPDEELYQSMLSTKSYRQVVGKLQCGRQTTREECVYTQTKEEGVQLSSMYNHLTIQEDELRNANGFSNFVHMEECVFATTQPREQQPTPVAPNASGGKERKRELSTVEKAEARALKKKKKLETAFDCGQQRNPYAILPQSRLSDMLASPAPATKPTEAPPVVLSSDAEDCKQVLMEKRFSGSSLTLPLLTDPVSHEPLPGSPYKTVLWQQETGRRKCYTHLTTALHSMAVARFLDALVLIPAEDVLGINVDCFYLTKDHSALLEAAGFLEPPNTRRAGFIQAPIILSKPLNPINSDCAMSSFNPDREDTRMAMELDPTLALVNPVKWTAEKDGWRQFNTLTGGPGTGKTTGLVQSGLAPDNRIDKALLCTPTNLLSCDFGNKFGCKTMTLHKALKWTIVAPTGDTMLPKDRYKMNVRGNYGKMIDNGHHIRGLSAFIVDEVTQQSPDILRDLVEVCAHNHIQLFFTGDFKLDPPTVYQMGPVQSDSAVINHAPVLINEVSAAQPNKWAHVTRTKVHRQLGDEELQNVFNRLRESDDATGLELLLATDWVPKISGKEWLQLCSPDTDMSVAPKHNCIQMATILKLRAMQDSERFKLKYCGRPTKLTEDQASNPQPEWFERYLLEFGLGREGTIYDGMTATVSKAEFKALFDNPLFNDAEHLRNTTSRKPKYLVFNKAYTRTSSRPDRTADVKGNVVQPLIVGTAHTVQGRELSADGKCFILYLSSERGSGGWELDFCKNSVYVSATRIRRRDQLYMVDVSDLAEEELGNLAEF